MYHSQNLTLKGRKKKPTNKQKHSNKSERTTAFIPVKRLIPERAELTTNGAKG